MKLRVDWKNHPLMSLCTRNIPFKAGENVVACVLTRRLKSQTRVQGSIKNVHVAFVKNHASIFTKRDIFYILILCCKFIFILIVAVVIELTFVLFQQPCHCLLVYSWGKHKSRGFHYPVLLSSRNIRFGR